MLTRDDYNPVSEDNDINVFELLNISDEEDAPEEAASLVSEKLDTIIEYEEKIHYALWTLISVISFIVVVRVLWTVFDKWFFGGV